MNFVSISLAMWMKIISLRSNSTHRASRRTILLFKCSISLSSSCVFRQGNEKNMKIIFPSHATIPFKNLFFSVNKRKARGKWVEAMLFSVKINSFIRNGKRSSKKKMLTCKSSAEWRFYWFFLLFPFLSYPLHSFVPFQLLLIFFLLLYMHLKGFIIKDECL